MPKPPTASKAKRAKKNAEVEDDAPDEAEDGDDAASQRSLYDMLSIPKNSTAAEIKKAYHRLALACHPDKHPDDPKAKERFQQLSFVKEILLDEEKRRVYDETGVIMGEDGLGDMSGKSFEELYQYYRAMYQQVTGELVTEWENKYPGSDMEREDLRDYYKKYEGNMSKVTEYIPFCESEDLWRIKEVVDSMIEAGELEATPKYAKFKPKKLSADAAARLKRERAPEEGWEEAKHEAEARGAGGGKGAGGGGGGKGGMGELMALIQAKQASRADAFDAMTAALEAKYGGGGGGGGKGGKGKGREGKAAKGRAGK